MQRARLLAALGLAQILFGSLAVVAKLAFEHLEPATVALVRIAGGAIFLVILVHGVLRRPLPGLRDLPALAILGVLGVLLNQVLYLEGLAITTAVGATLIMATIPLWTGVIALAVGQEKVNATRLSGLALGFAGVAVLVLGKGQGVGVPAGNVLVALNALSYAAFLVLARRVVPRLGFPVVLTWGFVAGALLVLPYSWSSAVAQDWGSLPIGAWLALAYVLLGATILAHGVNVWALGHTQSSTVAGLIYLQPFVATALAVQFLGERPGLGAAFAAILVLGGVALVAGSASMENSATAARKTAEAPRDEPLS